jgi:hypothetical protein
VRGPGPQLAEELDAVHARHLPIGEHQKRATALNLFETLHAIGCFHDIESAGGEDFGQRAAKSCFVLDNQHRPLHASCSPEASGRVTRKQEPLPCSLVTEILPLCI